MNTHNSTEDTEEQLTHCTQESQQYCACAGCTVEFDTVPTEEPPTLTLHTHEPLTLSPRSDSTHNIHNIHPRTQHARRIT